MNLDDLKQRAEKEIKLEYDAWKNLSGAERTNLTYVKMLQIIENEGKELFKHTLMVARAAWESRAWTFRGETSFPEFLCSVGGRYKQNDGKPSGMAYDMAGFITVVWPVLEQQGINPLKVAMSGWSKARMLVSTTRKAAELVTEGGAVTKRIEEAASIRLTPEKQEVIRDLVKDVINEDMSVKEMSSKVYAEPEKFLLSTSLNGDGTWNFSAEKVSNRDMHVVLSLLDRVAEVRLEG